MRAYVYLSMLFYIDFSALFLQQGQKFFFMKNVRLGKSNISVAPLAFGGNVFGWTVNEKQSFQLLDKFVGEGFNFIDTADVYSRWVPGNNGGESETIIGNWLKSRGKRSDVIIATKVGMDMGDGKKGLKKKYIVEAVEKSLTRLQTDYIDLYQTHIDDGSTPIEETLSALADLVKEGKVRIIGSSNFSPERLKISIEISKENGYPIYQTFQPEYNLYDREVFEKEIEDVCRENNLSVISYYSLASGFLTGKYRTKDDLGKSVRGNGVQKYLNERGFKILEALDKVSANYQATPASVAIAWLLTNPIVAAPIASATSTEQLETLTAAVRLSLDEESTRLLNEASAWK